MEHRWFYNNYITKLMVMSFTTFSAVLFTLFRMVQIHDEVFITKQSRIAIKKKKKHVTIVWVQFTRQLPKTRQCKSC